MVTKRQKTSTSKSACSWAPPKPKSGVTEYKDELKTRLRVRQGETR